MRYKADIQDFRAALEKIRRLAPTTVQIKCVNKRVHILATFPQGYADISTPADSDTEDGLSGIIPLKNFIKPSDIDRRATGTVEFDCTPGSALSITHFDAWNTGVRVWHIGCGAGISTEPHVVGKSRIFAELVPADCETFALLHRACDTDPASVSPRFTGVFITPDAAIATNNMWLVEASLANPVEFAAGCDGGIVPPQLAAFIAAGNPGMLEMRGDVFILTGSGYTVWAHCIEGSIPAFKKVFPPASRANIATLDTRDTIRTLKTLSKGMRTPQLVLKSLAATCTDISRGASKGQTLGRLDVLNGEIVDFSFNAKFMLDALSGYKGETFTFQTTDAETPTVLTRSDGVRAVIMPFQNVGKPN